MFERSVKLFVVVEFQLQTCVATRSVFRGSVTLHPLFLSRWSNVSLLSLFCAYGIEFCLSKS